MVTMISQDLSQFALHARAILGLPIPNIHQHGPSASSALVVQGTSSEITFGSLDSVLAQPDTQLRLFGKPSVQGKRRLAVGLARAGSVDEARQNARTMTSKIQVTLA